MLKDFLTRRRPLGPPPLDPDAFLGRPLVAIVRQALAPTKFWPTQLAILEAVQRHRLVSVRSCQGSGKTTAAAALVVAWLLRHRDAVCVTTAPTFRQVTELLWGQIRTLVRSAPRRLPGELSQMAYRLSPTRFAIGFSSDQAERVQGFHARHFLAVVDEASGVSQDVYDSLKGSLTTQHSHLLLIGNPTQVSGHFYDSQNSLRALYETIGISYTATPNFQGQGEVAPYLITQEFIDTARAEWGEDSPQYQVRVLGEFPRQGADTLIALSWVDAAVRRAPAPEDGQLREMGVDCARFGSDETAVCVRRSEAVVLTEAWTKFDTAFSAHRIADLVRRERVSVVRVDAVGVGGGVLDRLREMQREGELPHGIRLEEFSAAARPYDAERYRYRRDEVWAGLAERFKEGRIAALPEDVKLMGQLTAARHRYDAQGRLVMETKDELKKRGLKSPDRAEALMLAFAGSPCDSARAGRLLQLGTDGETYFGNVWNKEF